MNVEIGKAIKTEYKGEVYYFCCPHCQQAFETSPEEYLGTPSRNVAHRLKHVFKYAFVDMVKEIGPELLLGLALAALVVAIAPVGKFVGDYFGGGLGYLFSLVFGLMMYICSTASVPLVHAFISQGMNIGAGMVLLIVGPVTSWGTISSPTEGIWRQDPAYLSRGHLYHGFGFRLLLFYNSVKKR